MCIHPRTLMGSLGYLYHIYVQRLHFSGTLFMKLISYHVQLFAGGLTIYKLSYRYIYF